MKFLTRKRILAFLGFVALLFGAVVASLFIFVHSPGFETRARERIVHEIQDRTGATVSVKHFTWNIWQQRFRIEDLTLRGLEPPAGPALAVFPRIDVGLNLRSLFERKINLFELTLTSPEFHISVDADGKTNLPAPPVSGGKPLDLEVSIENFKILQGITFINERQIDTDFLLTNLTSESSFHSTTGILNSHLRYDGRFEHQGEMPIPYTFDADIDYTKGTLLPHRINLQSGSSILKLQGRINNALTTKIAGNLEYSGNVQVPFLNYFFPGEQFAGKADVVGSLQFAEGFFATRGKTNSDSVQFDNWKATQFRADYAYDYPEKRASFENLQGRIVGGEVGGKVTVENIPGPSRVVVDVRYADVDAAQLARSYPWSPKYRIFSNVTGTLQGWFEGRLERYSFSGEADLKSYNPPAITGVVPLALTGSTKYEIRPDEAVVANGDVRFGSTHVRADGSIKSSTSDLRVFMESSDLRDGTFIYNDSNGSGTFAGTLTGPIENPILNGDFTLLNHAYQKKWTIDNAVGHVRLDTLSEVATLADVHIKQGGSEIVVSGMVELASSPVDLNIQAVRVIGEDLRRYIDRQLGGTFSGAMRLTSFSPLKVEGDLRADNLEVDNRLVGNIRGHFRYFEPQIEMDSLSLSRNGSTLTGTMAFNRTTEALKFSGRLAAVDFESIRSLGLPDSLAGVIQQASIQGEGTLKQPNLRGTGTIHNLAFKGQVFPEVGVEVTSTGSTLNATIAAARNLNLVAHVNTSGANLPFTADATFNDYSLEQIAGFSQGTLKATGIAAISGLLKDGRTLQGKGRIDAMDAVVQDQTVRSTKPFTFDFNSDHLTLSSVTLTGQATEVSVAGTIGFSDQAVLGLDVQGRVDLRVLAAGNSQWLAGGTVNLSGRVRGTPRNPDLSGIAQFTNASFTRSGLFTSVTGLNGDLFFDGNRVTLNGIEGSVGGGTVRVEGNAVLRDRQLRAMNVRIESKDVRLRYPEGLRTVVDGALVLRGSLDAPVLEGNLQIVSMSYKSSFEDFLAQFDRVGVQQQSSALGEMRLGIHVEGGRNITIQNQLANVEARVNLDIKGTVNSPSMTGHVEASGGTLSFQGKRYSITRGNVDFIDPLRIDPSVDVQAETAIRNYRIILGINGRGDRLRLDMHSEPPLSQVEIVNLIAGGKTVEELATTGAAVPNSDALFKGGAASILSDALQERIAGSTVERLGLSRVRIGPDPNLISSGNQTTLRVTIDQQVSKDLSLTYSQDLASSRQQIIQIEYFVSKNTSILASRDETGAYGLDVKFRRRIK